MNQVPESEHMDHGLYGRFAVAYVLGVARERGGVELPVGVEGRLCDDLTDEECRVAIERGAVGGLKLHRFKRTMGLPRVARVIGILHGLAPERLLDIGSGRGAFLWPLLDAFPDLEIVASDRDPRQVADIAAVRAGGVGNLSTRVLDATRLDVPDRAFDVVTMLEVLEHIPDTRLALREVFRVARRFVVLSVPSTPDDNPEHIHLFGRAELERMCREAGAASVRFDYVLNHAIVVARKDG